MSIEISLVQTDKNGNERRVLKSFESGQEAASWFEKQPTKSNNKNKVNFKKNHDKVPPKE